MPDAKRDCPICAKPADGRWLPFCSRRCAEVDLGRWLTGVYRVSIAAEDEEAERRTGVSDPA